MVYVIILLFLIYFGLTVALTVGIGKAQHVKFEHNKDQHLISVIVPARNEAAGILFLLDDLANQDFPNFEVIIVNDNSEDATAHLAQNYALKDTRFTLVNNNSFGKKQALLTGISKANGSIIVTTDADCRVSARWLSIINQYFTPEIKMVFGGVRISAKGFSQTLQSMEFASVIGTGIASWSFSLPTMCNGANLAFLKSAFYEVKGYDGNLHIPSGDDEFLMRKILVKFPHGLQFVNEKEAVVVTSPSLTLKDFFFQRLRWAGKWKQNTSGYTVFLAVFIATMQLIFIISLFAISMRWHTQLFIILLVVKATGEWIFLKKICKYLNVHVSVSAFVILQILYPFYVMALSIGSNFIPYKWKGRGVGFNKPNTLTENRELMH